MCGSMVNIPLVDLGGVPGVPGNHYPLEGRILGHDIPSRTARTYKTFKT